MPAWGQIVRDMRQRIDSGELSVGARLPTENRLAEQYGVSRITIRRALGSLADDGYVDRVHGTGTFVSARIAPVHHDLLLGGSWRSRLEADGHTTSSRLISTKVVAEVPYRVTNAVADGFEPPELVGPWVFLERVQLVDEHPIGVSQSWLPSSLVPGLEAAPLSHGSLSRALDARFGIRVEYVDNRLLVGLASTQEAELLEAHVDVPLFVVVALNRLNNFELLEFSRTAWLASRVRFRAVNDTRSPTSSNAAS